MKSIYLDYAAATPLDPRVLRAMEPYFWRQFYNPSATYLAAREVRQALEQARSGVAKCLGSRATEIVFTAGATEANNLAIQGIMCQFPEAEVLVSAIEHESVLEPAKSFSCRRIPVSQTGVIMFDQLSNLINDNTALISIGYVNNEIGSVQPLRAISELLNQVRQTRRAQGNDLPVYLHSDAAQAPNYFDLQIARLGVDLMSANGGKIYGPKQSGVLYIRTGVKLQPLIVGGGQESNIRSGTENVAADVGFSTALKLAQKKRKTEAARLNNLRNLFVTEISRAVPKAFVNGDGKSSAPHILSLTFPEEDGERLVMELDESGIQAAMGSACSASSEEPSHVLLAIGLSEDQARSTLRFSFGRQTTEADVQSVIKRLLRLIH